MTKKRPTIKGKGADFFFEQQKPDDLGQRKATFYLPRYLVDRLDDVWLDLRKTHKKLRKSYIALIALDELLRDYENLHQDSKLLEHLNVKTSKQQ